MVGCGSKRTSFVGGPAVGVIGGTVAGVYRVWIGGAGTLPGVLSIVSAVAVGAVGYRLQKRDERWQKPLRILFLGVVIHVLVLLSQAFLPQGLYLELLTEVGPIMLVLFPAAFLLTVSVVLSWKTRKRAQAKLEESEQRYRSLFENSHAPMLIIDPCDGRILDANGKAAAYYGWSTNELCTMRVSDINVLSEEAVRVEMQDARAARRNYFEFQHRRKDGSVRDVAVYSGTVKVEGEDRLFSIVRDITGQKEAEKELSLLRYSTELSVIGVFRIAEPDGRIVYANRAVRETLGYTHAELRQLTMFDIDPTFTREQWLHHRREVRDGGGKTIETTHRRKDGTEFPVEVTITYLRYGEEEYSFAFARDITLRKQAEERLRESLREKEVLLREIHHRVKNNLAVITGMIRLQLHEIEDGDVSLEPLRKTRDRIEVMGLIHNMLYSEQDLAQVDMATVIHRIAVGLQDEYETFDSITVTTDLEQVPIELTSALPLGLIANEAITNAITHAFPTPGNHHISVRLKRVAQHADRYTLVVADNGTGVGADFDITAQTSLGFRMMLVLCQQINGELTIDGTVGTKVQLRFTA